MGHQAGLRVADTVPPTTQADKRLHRPTPLPGPVLPSSPPPPGRAWTVAAWILWTANAALGLWLFARHDGPVRVDRELWAGPLVVLLVHVTVALMIAELASALGTRGRARAARIATIGAPSAVLMLGWLPCLRRLG